MAMSTWPDYPIYSTLGFGIPVSTNDDLQLSNDEELKEEGEESQRLLLWPSRRIRYYIIHDLLSH